MFGGCHDSGYLLNLDQLNYNELSAARITLLETTPAHKGFVELANFKRVRFENVFRSEPLPDGPPLTYGTNGNSFVPPTSATPPTQPPALFRTNTNQSPRPSVSSPSPQTPPSSVSGKENNGDASWGTYMSRENPAFLFVIHHFSFDNFHCECGSYDAASYVDLC